MSDRPDPGALRARVRFGAGAALVVLLVGAAIAVFVTAVTPRGSDREVVAAASPSPSLGAVVEPETAPAAIFVHVLGQVAAPGLYELREGDRVVDAIAAAGGLTASADQAGVNLARPLVDGEQLVVPAVGEVATPGAAGGAAGGGVASGGLVDLNTADAAALDTLPRIGPAMAQRIIDWRAANGPFRSVEDLLAVSGIGSKTIEALRPLVTT